EVLGLLARGLATKQVARRLGISPKDVRPPQPAPVRQGRRIHQGRCDVVHAGAWIGASRVGPRGLASIHRMTSSPGTKSVTVYGIGPGHGKPLSTESAAGSAVAEFRTREFSRLPARDGVLTV